jgi:pyridoxamine 5'-phosphate oxidase
MPLVLPHHTLEEIPQLLYTELKKGMVQKKHPFRNVVFSTSAQESPMSRWVVCRHITYEQGFYIYTDGRSQKILELNQNPNCNLLFYHDRHGLQINCLELFQTTLTWFCSNSCCSSRNSSDRFWRI